MAQAAPAAHHIAHPQQNDASEGGAMMGTIDMDKVIFKDKKGCLLDMQPLQPGMHPRAWRVEVPLWPPVQTAYKGWPALDAVAGCKCKAFLLLPRVPGFYGAGASIDILTTITKAPIRLQKEFLQRLHWF